MVDIVCCSSSATQAPRCDVGADRPRTIEHLNGLLSAADVELSDEVLDQLGAVCAPGTNVNAADGGYDPPAITDKRLRRR
jgi:hypothetical protein